MPHFYCDDPEISRTLALSLSAAGLDWEPSNDVSSAAAFIVQKPPQPLPTSSHLLCAPSAFFQSSHFLALPASLVEMVAAFKAASMESSVDRVVLYQGWQLKQHQIVHEHKASIELAEKEADLLHRLVTQSETLVGRETLLKEIWGYGDKVETNTLESHIYRLRGKLEPLELPKNCGILTKENGYMWSVNSE